jgi:hypothetical protein
LAAVKDDAEKKRLDGEIKKINEDVPFAWTLGVRERGPSPPATHVLARGNPESPGAEVKPAFLRVLDSSPPVLPVSDADAPTSGRRLALAQWIASPTNPLTARVLVNRIWQHHFGQGLVRTPSDFGRSGTTPTHPELLDWLATEFIESGWSLKKLHRTILLSQVYRQSSRANREPAAKIDPDNRLLWRQNLRRLEAEALRDSILSLAGTLNLQMAGRGFFPHLGGEILAGQSRPGLDWEVSSEAEKNRRSIYAFVRRTMAVPFLESFDYNNTTSPLAERVTTTVAPQALLLLNDSFLQDQAAAFARRLRLEAGSGLPAQIQRAYKLALQRSPTQRELTLAGEFLQRQTDAFKALASRISFQLDVASALATDYFTKLPSTEFLVGPRAGWSYYRGFWAPPYEGIRVVDRARAPFALWNDISYKDGTITATLQLASSSEFAGLLFRTVTADDVARGYEVIFDPRQEQIVLRRHDGKWVDLATAPAHLSWLEPIQVEIESSGPKIRISLEDDPQPMLEIIDDTPILEAGRVGIRTWGGAVSVDRWVISTVSFAGASSSMISAGTESPQDQALQSFCLLILNLNEIAYVD